MNKYASYQFALFRVYLGGYIFIVLLFSIPSSAALWSNQGLVPDPVSNLTYGLFPNLLNWFDAPYQVIFFLLVLLIFSLLFIAGFSRRLVAVLLWYGWTCLINRNNLIINPAIPYTGWLLLACAVVPGGESFSLSSKNEHWYMPSLLFKTAWFLFAFGYFISGIDKLYSESWYNGTALTKILDCPLAFNYCDIINYIPTLFMKYLNWLVIVMEISVLPLAIFTNTRKWAWIIATIIQLGILISLNIAPIVFGMLSMHLFVFDRSWISGIIEPAKANYTKPLKQYLCN